MAIMYPQNISEYMPTDSERIFYNALKVQLPDTYEVFYSVHWSQYKNGVRQSSEADFIVTSPDYGYICLEVKGGNQIRIEGNNNWYVIDAEHGERKLKRSPYLQAEDSMYYFRKIFSQTYNIDYSGIFGAGVAFPFYSLPNTEVVSNRDRSCTIELEDMNSLEASIKRIFKTAAGSSFGRRMYSKMQHKLLLELIRKRIAISAAAGALVKYKDQQLQLINRVQDNYVFLLQKMKSFYLKGGAGTGKTWIAMKMASAIAQHTDEKVLFLCVSENLAIKVKSLLRQNNVIVRDMQTLTSELNLSNDTSTTIIPDDMRYDAIFVDEAQDFSVEEGRLVQKCLINPSVSKLCAFYDDSQTLTTDDFIYPFGNDLPVFCLRENIRNTANIYAWAAQKTNLGTEVIVNPVEGPTPTTEYFDDKLGLTYRLEQLFKEYLEDEHLPSSSITIIVDDIDHFIRLFPDGIAKWSFARMEEPTDSILCIASVADYKGLESDMVIYIHGDNSSVNERYTAYTRAKYYLIELIRRNF